MFRNDLHSKLASIFGFRKTTYDAPSVGTDGSMEQDTLFIDISECQSRITEGKQIAKVFGSLTVFSQVEKLPFGYFNKRIQQASHQLTKKFFFFDIDLNPSSSPARIQNIVERRVRFVYLYSAEYDPWQGELTSLDITVTTEENP